MRPVGMRYQVTVGWGTPVTLQTSSTVSPSCTTTVAPLDRWSMILAGSARSQARTRHPYVKVKVKFDVHVNVDVKVNVKVKI